MQNHARRLVIIAALALTLFPGAFVSFASAGPTVQTVIANLQAASRKIVGMEATLRHRRKNTQLGVREPEQVGTLLYRPGQKRLLRIDYSQPQAKVVAVNGNNAVLLEVALKQAYESTVQNIANQAHGANLLSVLTNAAQLKANFDVALDGDENVNGQATTKLTLTPKTPNKYSRIEVWIDHQQWLPIKQVMHTRSDVTEITLTDIKLKSIPESAFKVDTKGYKVIKG